MIHYFNPGHETAVLHESKHYQPKANIVTIQQQLSYLPLWYAAPNDFVLVENSNKHFTDILLDLPISQPITIKHFADKSFNLSNQKVQLWGLSPQTIHFFEQLNNTFSVNLQIPIWTKQLQLLNSRLTALNILAHIIDSLPSISPNILPSYFANIENINTYVSQQQQKLLIKAPYSSSGRGLVWLSPSCIASSEKQIISGILKKQKIVSIEKVLDKQLDFSLHFYIHSTHSIQFIGYSIFYTNSKGVYKSSLLANQEYLKQRITSFISYELLDNLKNIISKQIQKYYSPYYCGNIGIDMLIYKQQNNFLLHPCVEINMRKTMGYLAIILHQNFLQTNAYGFLQIYHNPINSKIWQKHLQYQNLFPPIIDNKKILYGYLPLVPITENSRFHAFLLVNH